MGLKKIKLPKNNLSKLTIMIGILGTLCLVICNFIPCLTIGGIPKFFLDDQKYILVLAIVSMITIFMGGIIIPSLTGLLSLWYFIDYSERVKWMFNEQQAAMQILYGIGYYLLIVGVALILTYIVFGIREKLKIRKMKRSSKKTVISNDTDLASEPLTPVVSETKETEQLPNQTDNSIWNTNVVEEDLKTDNEITSNEGSKEPDFIPTTEAAKRNLENPKEYNFPEMPVKEPAPFNPTTNSAIKYGNATNPKVDFDSSKEFNPFTMELPEEELKRNDSNFTN